MPTKTIYFQDSSGNDWVNDLNEYGPNQYATAQMPAGATGAELSLNLSVGTSDGLGCAIITGVTLITTKGQFQIPNTGFGGNCYNAYGVTSTCSGGINPLDISLDISEYINFSNTTPIALQITGCFTVANVPAVQEVWYMNNVSINYTLPIEATYGTVNITVSAGGVFAPEIPVSLVNQNTSQGPSDYTNESGLVSFTDVPIGSYYVEISYGQFQTVKQPLTVSSGVNTVPITLGCNSGYTLCKGGCISSCGTGTSMDMSTCQCASSLVSGITTPILLLIGGIGAVAIGVIVVSTIKKGVPEGTVREEERFARRREKEENGIIGKTKARIMGYME